MHQQNLLKSVVAELPLVKAEKTLYRVVDCAALNSLSPVIPLYTLGPGRNGQRYTPKGGPNSIYAAEDLVTAFAEYCQIGRSILAEGSTPISPANPTTQLTLSVNLVKVLDLKDSTILQALDTSIAELTGPWRAQMLKGEFCPTHVLAECVFLNGAIEAMRFPSAHDPKFSNFIIWEDRISPTSYVEVLDTTGRLSARLPSS